MDELDYLGIDDETGQLFWHDKAVVLERKVTLEGPTFWIAVAATAAAVVSAVWPIIDYFWLP